MNKIFQIVANALVKMAAKLHITYNEANIIVYYLLIPLSWTILLDCITKVPVATPLFVIAWLIIFAKVHAHFRQWCDKVFKRSVQFLLWFKCIGWNYVVSSVIICVVVPVLVYALLIWRLNS